ncbi:MAG: type II toxin-antitoxin system RelE/ParE family toxin [Magnetospirillum sp.]|nr:type II toxin-antitoxin system RelE/ParE family toxin [Magnetospirillum sp.]
MSGKILRMATVGGDTIVLDGMLADGDHRRMAQLIPPPVFKQLAKMPKVDAARLLDRLEKIAEAPEATHANVLPLVGEVGVFRIRQGDWRAVFSIEGDDVILDRVAHRREVYR